MVGIYYFGYLLILFNYCFNIRVYYYIYDNFIFLGNYIFRNLFIKVKRMKIDL